METKGAFETEDDSGKLTHDSTPHASLGNDDAHQAGSFSMKPPLPIDEQIDHLADQGISIGSRAFAKRCLLGANYYRLRGYWMTFEQNGTVRKGTRLEDIWAIHEFDRELRLWLWRLIERVEVKARTQFAYVLSLGFGPDALSKPELFSNKKSYKKSMESVGREINHAKKQGMPCVRHNLDKYGKLPLWAAVEVMSMGTVSSLYGNLREDLVIEGHADTVAEEIAAAFGVSAPYLKSWLRHLTMVRNICAHHNRFYNRLLKTRPRMMRRDKRWSGNREFPTFITLERIYEISWPNEWKEELRALDNLISSYPSVSLRPMGFPDNWREVLGIDNLDINKPLPRERKRSMSQNPTID